MYEQVSDLCRLCGRLKIWRREWDSKPTLPFRVNTLSKRAPSATRPSLRRTYLVGRWAFGDASDSPCPFQSVPASFILWARTNRRKWELWRKSFRGFFDKRTTGTHNLAHNVTKQILDGKFCMF